METTPATGGRSMRTRPGPIVAWSVLALLQIASGLVAFATRDDIDDTNPLFETEFVATSIVVYSILVLLTLAIAAGYSLDVRRALGFRRFEVRWLGAAAAVIVASFAVGALMSAFGDPAEEQGLAPDRWEPGKAAVFAAAAVVVVLFVPFAEELFFRGLGVGVLAFAGPVVAISIPAIAFALAHGIPLAIPTLMVLGGGLAWIRYRSASVWPCFLAHATWNGLALAVAAATTF
jgi:membrane protease YdiL (CAAX protease family)